MRLTYSQYQNSAWQIDGEKMDFLIINAGHTGHLYKKNVKGSSLLSTYKNQFYVDLRCKCER